jgi:hypothetical protein
LPDHLFEDPRLRAVLSSVAAYAPGFAGSVLSLAFIEKLTRRGRVVAVCVGIAAAVYLAPAITDIVDMMTPGKLPDSVKSATQFLTGLCAMGALPPFLGWLKRVAGDPLTLLKGRAG